MARVSLNKRQTRTLSRMFKKFDFDEIAFDTTETGDVNIRVTDTAGWTADVVLMEDGRASSFKLIPQDEAALRSAGIIE